MRKIILGALLIILSITSCENPPLPGSDWVVFDKQTTSTKGTCLFKYTAVCECGSDNRKANGAFTFVDGCDKYSIGDTVSQKKH